MALQSNKKLPNAKAGGWLIGVAAPETAGYLFHKADDIKESPIPALLEICSAMGICLSFVYRARGAVKVTIFDDGKKNSWEFGDLGQLSAFVQGRLLPAMVKQLEELGQDKLLEELGYTKE